MTSHHIWNIIVSLTSRMFPRLFKPKGHPPNKFASQKGVQLGHGVDFQKRQKIHRFFWFPTYALEIFFWLAKFVSEISATISWQKIVKTCVVCMIAQKNDIWFINMKHGKQILGQIWQGLKFNPRNGDVFKQIWHRSTAMDMVLI